MSVRFLLLSDARTGTMMLTDALDRHPDVSFFNFYAAPPGQATVHYNNWQRFQDNASTTHRGTTMHRIPWTWIERFTNLAPDTFWDVMRQKHDRWLLLHRRNVLKQYLSYRLAAETGRRKVDKPRATEHEPKPITMDLDKLGLFISSIMMQRQHVDKHFPSSLVLAYENMVGDWDGAINRVQEYLDLPLRALPQVTHKQETRLLRDAIANYHEVARWADFNGYANWIEED